MTLERELFTMKETLTFKCILPLDIWSHYYAVFVMMKNKHKLYLSDYYKTIRHVKKQKILNLSFKTFFHTHISKTENTE